VATSLFGNAGLVMTATMLLMAITLAGSAESIVVFSLVAYDVHQTYINLEADGGKVLLLSKVVNEILGRSRNLLSVLPHASGTNRAWVCHFMTMVFGGSGGLSCSHTPPAGTWAESNGS
jgi:Na+/proline symporter